jgi:aryl-alcohol dehydrogenase-like predicted oxidoreductase
MTTLKLSDAPRPLGKSEFSVYPLAWGMWRMSGDAGAARERIAAARDIGITLFDTADIYGLDSGHTFGAAEALLGDVFKADPGLRKEMVLATKGGIVPGTPYNSSAAYLQEACDASLKRLGVERIDLYQIHRPDLATHPAEVAEGLVKLKRAGKIGAVGVSNYTAAQTAALQAWLDLPIVSHQPEFSPLRLDPLTDGVLDQAMERDMAVLAWSPLAGGRLADAPAGGTARAVIEELDRLALREGVSRACLALAWVMTHPSRPIPIIGSQSPERIRQMKDVFKVRLERADWYAVLVAARGAPMP